MYKRANALVHGVRLSEDLTAYGLIRLRRGCPNGHRLQTQDARTLTADAAMPPA